MTWTIDFLPKVKKDLKKLDKKDDHAILDYLQNEIQSLDDPKSVGKDLKGNLQGLWRYDFNKFRITVDIQDEKFVILVIKIGTRENFYKQVKRPKKDASVISFSELNKKI